MSFSELFFSDQDVTRLGKFGIFVLSLIAMLLSSEAALSQDSCFREAFFLSGPPMSVVRDISYFPNDSVLNGWMRPGDVIGLSLNVKDPINLVTHCSCNYANEIQLPGTYFMKMKYFWNVKDGNLIVPWILPVRSSEQNSMMYQVPFCSTDSIIHDTILCIVSDDPTAERLGPTWRPSEDSSMTATIIITTEYHPKRKSPKGSAGAIKAWEASHDPWALRVTIHVDSLKRHLALPPYMPSTGSDCTQAGAPVWNALTPLSGGFDIQEDAAPNLCPDYLTLLSCERFDTNQFTFNCTAASSCSSSTSTMNISDPVYYQWSIVSGNGAFPLGTDGPCVVFQRSRSSATTVQCVITDSRTQANDPPVMLTYTVSQAMKPKALVGVGKDFDNNEGNNTFGQPHPAFRQVAAVMLANYQQIGYDTNFIYHIGLSAIKAVLQAPCYQAMCLVAHGTIGHHGFFGAMSLDSIFGQRNPSRFTPEDVPAASPMGCRAQPLFREVDLLGCSSAIESWPKVFPFAHVEGFKKEETGEVVMKTALALRGRIRPPHDLSAP